MAETKDVYWQDYSNHQRVKHELIRRYLGGWYPKLGSWAGRVLYFDTHAGRGRHKTGEPGSPLVALNTLLTHSGQQLLSRSEFYFYLIEQNRDNAADLQYEIDALKLPANVKAVTHTGDCFDYLTAVRDYLRENNKKMAPAFIFVDPFSFMVPFSLLKELLELGSVELFVNVIWRELDMALSHGRRVKSGAWVDNLNKIFGSDVWRKIEANTSEERANQTLDILGALVGAKWITSVKMTHNERTVYMLIHFANHDAGRDLMKDSMWGACEVSDLGFHARKDGQQYLLGPNANIEQLRNLILDAL